MLGPGNAFPVIRKTCRIVICFYIDCSNAQLLFIHVHSVDLLGYPLGRSLESPSDESTTLLGVGKILAVEDLEFPVLLDKSVGDDSFVVVRGPEDGRKPGCELHRGYVL